MSTCCSSIANYGLLPNIAGHAVPTQLKAEFPLSAAGTHGNPYAFGIGAAKLGLKFNFYTNEQTGLSMSVYRSLNSSPPGTHAADKGIAEPGQEVDFSAPRGQAISRVHVRGQCRD